MELGGKSYWSTTFHTYGLYVGRDETIYYFDGIEVLRHTTNDISKEKPLFLPDKLRDWRNKWLAYRPRTLRECIGYVCRLRTSIRRKRHSIFHTTSRKK